MSFEAQLDKALQVLRRVRRKPAASVARCVLCGGAVAGAGQVCARCDARAQRRVAGGKARHVADVRLSYAAPWDAKARAGRGGWRPFVRRTMGRSGAYVIRMAKSGAVLYVGLSDSGRLYRTMVRHFEEWSRDKDFWAQSHNRSHGAPGETFDRTVVEVAVRLCAPSAARAAEADLIRKLKPRYNEMTPEGQDVVPF
ncbi:MAG: hypothetical protein MUF54_24820 [Polyangiaceae bacterium]|nr:hypothetical protein [Polyangiaceae bacterium]